MYCYFNFTQYYSSSFINAISSIMIASLNNRVIFTLILLKFLNVKFYWIKLPLKFVVPYMAFIQATHSLREKIFRTEQSLVGRIYCTNILSHFCQLINHFYILNVEFNKSSRVLIKWYHIQYTHKKSTVVWVCMSYTRIEHYLKINSQIHKDLNIWRKKKST